LPFGLFFLSYYNNDSTPLEALKWPQFAALG
jgi:hypothetical protein